MANKRINQLTPYVAVVQGQDVFAIDQYSAGPTYTTVGVNASSFIHKHYQECFLVDATTYANGYITLTYVPTSTVSVACYMNGIKQYNRDAISSSTAVGDFSVDSTLSNKKVYIINGVSGGPTDLSADIQQNDILTFEYPYYIS